MELGSVNLGILNLRTYSTHSVKVTWVNKYFHDHPSNRALFGTASNMSGDNLNEKMKQTVESMITGLFSTQPIASQCPSKPVCLGPANG